MTALLLFLRQHWRLTLALLLSAALWLSREQLHSAETQASKAEQALVAYKQDAEKAQLKQRTDAAEKGAEALLNHEAESKALAPVVLRVSNQLDRICMRDETDVRHPGAGDLPSAGVRDEDAQARADAEYLADVKSDLAGCAEELSRFRNGRALLFQIMKTPEGATP
jgi:hypothetical protein